MIKRGWKLIRKRSTTIGTDGLSTVKLCQPFSSNIAVLLGDPALVTHINYDCFALRGMLISLDLLFYLLSMFSIISFLIGQNMGPMIGIPLPILCSLLFSMRGTVLSLIFWIVIGMFGTPLFVVFANLFLVSSLPVTGTGAAALLALRDIASAITGCLIKFLNGFGLATLGALLHVSWFKAFGLRAFLVVKAGMTRFAVRTASILAAVIFDELNQRFNLFTLWAFALHRHLQTQYSTIRQDAQMLDVRYI